jgi:hypothetical protein
MCVLILYNFHQNNSHAKKNSVRYYHKCACLDVSTCYSCNITMELEFSQQIFKEYSISFIHSFISFSLRGQVGRNQSPVLWPVWLWHTASCTSSWGWFAIAFPWLNIIFHENPSSGSQDATCCQTYRHEHNEGNESLLVTLWMWLKLALIMWRSLSREVDNPNLCKTRGNIPTRLKFSSSKVLCEESQALANLLFLLLPVKKFNA